MPENANFIMGVIPFLLLGLEVIFNELLTVINLTIINNDVKVNVRILGPVVVCYGTDNNRILGLYPTYIEEFNEILGDVKEFQPYPGIHLVIHPDF